MTSTNEPLGQADRTEGDVNLSDRRLAWQQANVSDATRETLERDSAAFCTNPYHRRASPS